MVSADYSWPQSFESHLTCKVWTDKIMSFPTSEMHSFSASKVDMRGFKLGNVLSFLKTWNFFVLLFFLKGWVLKNTLHTIQGKEKKPSLPQKFNFGKKYKIPPASMIWSVSYRRIKSLTQTNDKTSFYLIYCYVHVYKCCGSRLEPFQVPVLSAEKHRL